MIDPGKKRRVLRGDDRAAAVARARDLHAAPGASVRTVAAELGVSYGAANRLITESGATLRTRGGKPRPAETEA